MRGMSGPFASLRRYGGSRGRRGARFPGRLIGQGEQYPYERRAVADTVVNASEEDAAALIAFDEGEGPERPVQVQGRGEQLRYGIVEGLRIPRRRQDDAPNVCAQIELRIGLPIGTGSEGAFMLYDALAKAVVDQEALLQQGQDMFIVERFP